MLRRVPGIVPPSHRSGSRMFDPVKRETSPADSRGRADDRCDREADRVKPLGAIAMLLSLRHESAGSIQYRFAVGLKIPVAQQVDWYAVVQIRIHAGEPSLDHGRALEPGQHSGYAIGEADARLHVFLWLCILLNPAINRSCIGYGGDVGRQLAAQNGDQAFHYMRKLADRFSVCLQIGTRFRLYDRAG